MKTNLMMATRASKPWKALRAKVAKAAKARLSLNSTRTAHIVKTASTKIVVKAVTSLVARVMKTALVVVVVVAETASAMSCLIRPMVVVTKVKATMVVRRAKIIVAKQVLSPALTGLAKHTAAH